mmetsp:Transcript_44409/g.100178  ORF Transcript_44409/g.100178 Transcript_44409/m.100178 type:complete len:257 (-) Transcript_44409:257-1027(-)
MTWSFFCFLPPSDSSCSSSSDCMAGGGFGATVIAPKMSCRSSSRSTPVTFRPKSTCLILASAAALRRSFSVNSSGSLIGPSPESTAAGSICLAMSRRAARTISTCLSNWACSLHGFVCFQRLTRWDAFLIQSMMRTSGWYCKQNRHFRSHPPPGWLPWQFQQTRRFREQSVGRWPGASQLRQSDPLTKELRINSRCRRSGRYISVGSASLSISLSKSVDSDGSSEDSEVASAMSSAALSKRPPGGNDTNDEPSTRS